MASNEPKSTPEYGKLKNFWEATSYNNGSSTNNSVTKKPETNGNGFHHNPTTTIDMANQDLTPSVIEFDQDVLDGCLSEYLKVAQGLGGEIAEHAALVQKAFMAQRDFLVTATRFAKPGDAQFQQLLGPTANAITEIQKFRESRRSSPVFNHLSGISESIPALAWVTIAPTPGPHIKEMNDAGQFYTNRVLKDFKEKPGHAEWAKSWIGTLVALQAYVKKNHTTGLVWGKQAMAGGPTGGPQPPPPPPAFEMPDLSSMTVSDERANLFAELNKGEDVTKGLKKVSAEMQTHKNPSLRASAVVPATGSSSVNGSSGPKAPVSKPPKFALEGKKWVVEYQVGKRDLKIEDVEMNQVIYLFACKDSTITVKGKLNSIVVDSCVKSAIVFDSLVASVEFVNCRDCQMQVMGAVPTITIDKVDGLQMFLSKESMHVEIVSAKSSALNVMVPKQDGDFAEYPVPEQFKTTVHAKGLTTVPTEMVGV
ncbi:adenylyl cyclase-associated protein 1 isoform X2 [Folsomia candida]|uniref:adenylyl cyclase-associated protein 1 isoform X2 n=1 Tax=Folsomia candida TaxID=158441 RepID=UPI000B8F768A|nr:adenylyl cyclase-associated protein 1 isoform X2 [Folsomia candida]